MSVRSLQSIRITAHISLEGIVPGMKCSAEIRIGLDLL